MSKLGCRAREERTSNDPARGSSTDTRPGDNVGRAVPGELVDLLPQRLVEPQPRPIQRNLVRILRHPARHQLPSLPRHQLPLTAAPNPLCTPLTPSNFHVFFAQSNGPVYTLPEGPAVSEGGRTGILASRRGTVAGDRIAPRRPWSSPSSCRRVLTTSKGFVTGAERVSWVSRPRRATYR